MNGILFNHYSLSSQVVACLRIEQDDVDGDISTNRAWCGSIVDVSITNSARLLLLGGSATMIYYDEIITSYKDRRGNVGCCFF